MVLVHGFPGSGGPAIPDTAWRAGFQSASRICAAITFQLNTRGQNYYVNHLPADVAGLIKSVAKRKP